MREIRVSNSDRFAIVDDVHYERLSKFNWHISCQRSGSIHRTYKVNGMTKHVSMAQEVRQIYDTMFDHKDRDPSNNLDENLREVTYRQNARNRSKLDSTSSKYKGVYFYKLNGTWQAYIYVNRKKKHLGYFNTEVEAALTYNKYASELFGDFANLNIIIQ